MLVYTDEIKNFDGIFGIENPDWENVKDNYMKNTEMSVEDDYNMIDGIVNNGDNRAEIDAPPTVADFERDVNDGKPISILELVKMFDSLLSKLEKMTDEEFDELEKFPDFNLS